MESTLPNKQIGATPCFVMCLLILTFDLNEKYIYVLVTSLFVYLSIGTRFYFLC